MRPDFFLLLSPVQSPVNREDTGALQGYVVNVPGEDDGLHHSNDVEDAQRQNRPEDNHGAQEKCRPARTIVFSVLISKIKRER